MTDLDRRRTLAALDILDTPSEAEFDDIVRLASLVCGMPVSLISFVDGERQWFKAEHGFGRRETPIGSSICVHAIQQPDLFVIPDTIADERTAANPLVIGDPKIRFYAGVPLVTSDEVALGTLCVLDTKPNRLSDEQASALRALARQVMTQLELRKLLINRRVEERRNAAILDSAVDYGIISLDLQGAVTTWNEGAERLLGWTADEMMGRPAHIIFTEEDVRAGVPEHEMGATLLHGRGNDERWHRRKDGSRFWASGEMMPLKGETGTIEGFIKILRDRTRQHLAETTLKRQTGILQTVTDYVGQAVFQMDPAGRITFANPAAERIFGWRSDEMVGQRLHELLHHSRPDGSPFPVAECRFVAALSTGETLRDHEDVFFHKDGTPRSILATNAPVVADGQVTSAILTITDITERKRSEALLAESEARWRGLFTGMQEGFFLAELIRDGAGQASDYRILETNEAFATQSGIGRACIGLTGRDLIPDHPQNAITHFQTTVDTGEPQNFEIEMPRLGRWFEIRSHREAGERFACLFLDITPRKRAESRRAGLMELGDRLRDGGSIREIATTAAEILGRTLGLSRAGYGSVDLRAETITIVSDWTAAGLVPLAGLGQFSDYGAIIEQLKSGQTVAIDDVSTDPRTVDASAAWSAAGVRSLLNLPLFEHGSFVAVLYANASTPHAWSAEEIDYVRTVADRTRAAIGRVEAEEQQRVLNQELSHRMKNMLAMVQAIATQTMRNAPDIESAKTVLEGRLIALSHSHDLLLGGAMARTQMRDLVAGAVSTHADDVRRFVIDGPVVSVGARAAMSLALMLHELATNAVKYGALSQQDGHVAIGWTLAGAGDDLAVHLRWQEIGGPPVVSPTRTGFGTRLIERGLAGNFRGSADLAYPVDGVICTITAPYSGLQAEDAPRA